MESFVSTSDVLKRTARELEHLCAATRDLEDTVTEMMHSEASRSAVVSLQSIDLVTQTLAALTDFVGEIGDQIGASHQTDILRAADSIKLGDLRARLLNAEQRASASISPEVF